MALDSNQSVIALDYGDARVGVALASTIARIPSPLTTLNNDDQLLSNLKNLITEHSVDILIVGYPRNLAGQATKQTDIVNQFIEKLKVLDLRIIAQDESLTSVQAEAELKSRGTQYSKADIDALAATLILEDYLSTTKKMR